MASTRNVTGVVLRRRLFKHHDRVYSIFTKEEGKLFARAQGVLKIRSKLAGQLEPYRVAEFHIAQSRTIDKIAGCVTVEPFSSITKDVKTAAAAASVAEIVDILHREGQPDEQSWQLLLTILRKINQKSVNLLTIYAFSWKMVRYAGFQPQWEACVACKQPRREWAYIDPSRGGAVCTVCQPTSAKGAQKAIEILNQLDHLDLDHAETCVMDQETWNHVAFAIRRSIEVVVDAELQSFNLLHRELQPRL